MTLGYRNVVTIPALAILAAVVGCSYAPPSGEEHASTSAAILGDDDDDDDDDGDGDGDGDDDDDANGGGTCSATYESGSSETDAWGGCVVTSDCGGAGTASTRLAEGSEDACTCECL